MDELEIIAQPNDAYFKQVFSNPQRATLFFQTHLPAEIVARIDWTSLKTEAASFVKQTLQQTHSDLLYSVSMDGRTLKLYLLFEHQTTVDPTMPLRVLSYVLEILQSSLKSDGLPLPPVLPFILHQGPDRWTASPCFEDLFALSEDAAEALLPFLPKFRHALLDLSQRDPDKDEFHDSLRLVFQLMKLARQKKLTVFLQWIAAEMARPDWEVEEALMLLSYLYTMCVDATIDEAQIAHSLEHKPNLKENIMSLAEKLIARGEARGVTRGKAEGAWIGKIQLLEKMMGAESTPSQELEGLGLVELEDRFTALEQKYASQFKRL